MSACRQRYPEQPQRDVPRAAKIAPHDPVSDLGLVPHVPRSDVAFQHGCHCSETHRARLARRTAKVPAKCSIPTTISDRAQQPCAPTDCVHAAKSPVRGANQPDLTARVKQLGESIDSLLHSLRRQRAALALLRDEFEAQQKALEDPPPVPDRKDEPHGE